METDAQAAAEFGLSDALPEGWRPEDGSLIIGRITRLTKGWSDQRQEFYPILVIHDELTDKDVAVHGFHFVLLDRLTALRPQEGERIGIKMGPKVPLKSNPNRSVQTYTVKVEGRSEDVWGDITNPRTANTTQSVVKVQGTGSRQEEIPVADAHSDDDIPF